MDKKLIKHVTLLCAWSLSLVIIFMVGSMIAGLYDQRVDNEEVFKILGPAFNTVIGAFVGVLAGIQIGNNIKE